MFFYVYVLESTKADMLYIGVTKDLKERFQEHNRGDNFSTRHSRLWRLIHYEAYLNKDDARRRENYLKTNQGSRLLKRLLKEYLYAKKHESKN